MARILSFSLVAAWCVNVSAADPDATIHVAVGKQIGVVSRYSTGACIEDVNHEIYGGLYSQMVFGESFQEPPMSSAPEGFAAYGGAWQVKDGELWAGDGAGPKLIRSDAKLRNGEVTVEIYFPDRKSGNAGLILRVSQPGVGADRFTGYEMALHPDSGTLLLGRHRQNWELIRTVPCPVPIEKWIQLKVRLIDRSIEILVDGERKLQYDDNEHPLEEGLVGLRTWQREARFRKLAIQVGNESRDIPFVSVDQTNDVVSGMWGPVRRGDCQGSLAISREAFVGSQSQQMTLSSSTGEIGVENQGLNRWGMNFVEGKPYQGIVWAKSDKLVSLNITLEDKAGAAKLAETKVEVNPGKWQRIGFQLTPSRSESRGRLLVSLTQPGSVQLGYVSLHPGDWGRFEGLPVRRDVTEALKGHGLTVLRYGGSMVNCADYRWKQMVGPRDSRQPYKGTWYPYSTNGWGIIDFLSYCEAAGFLGIPDLSIDESPEDMRDFVEYVNGPEDSLWGRKRAADGHPAPFRLKYIQLGNEEAVNETYWQKFRPLVQAIWKYDPDIIPVVGDFAYSKPIVDPFNFPGAPSINSLAAHKQILDFAKSQGKPVWFDIHIWNDKPRDADPQIEVLDQFIGWLEKLSPRADFRVCVFEENSGNHLWQRGLAHARTVNRLQRFGDRVPIVCAANCLQPDGQNDNGWDQGLVFLSPSRVWSQPSVYVTQLMTANKANRLLKTDVSSPGDALDVTSRLSDNGKELVLQIVNSDNRPLWSRISFSDFKVVEGFVRVSQIAGHLEEQNTEFDPDRFIPVNRVWVARPDEKGDLMYLVPAQSFSTLEFVR